MTYLTSQLGHAESKHDPSMGRPPPAERSSSLCGRFRQGIRAVSTIDDSDEFEDEKTL